MTGALDILSKLPALAEDAGKTAGALAPSVEAVAALAADPATAAAIDRIIAVLTAVRAALPVLGPAAKQIAADMRALAQSTG